MSNKTATDRYFLDPDEDFLANLDMDLGSDTAIEEANCMDALAMQSYKGCYADTTIEGWKS